MSSYFQNAYKKAFVMFMNLQDIFFKVTSDFSLSQEHPDWFNNPKNMNIFYKKYSAYDFFC